MNDKTFDAISVITIIILLPMVVVSGHAYWSGGIQFSEYVSMWSEPVALLLGFWLRGIKES